MTPAEALRALCTLRPDLPEGAAVTVPLAWLSEALEGNAAAPSAPTSNGAADPTDEQLLTVEEVAGLFGLSPDWLYRHWRAVGGVKLGRKVLRFPASALRQYIASRSKAR